MLANHLALVNVTLALEGDKDVPDPDSEQMSEATRKARLRRAVQQQKEFKEFIGRMRSSPLEYARQTGYHDLFGLEPPERKPVEKSPEERIGAGLAAARRALASFVSGEE